MLNKATLLGALGLLSSTYASPLELAQRDACNHDNLLRCFIDTRYSVSATSYCAALTPYTTTVATVTATATQTSWTTVVDSTQTDTISSTATVYTATVPSATVTVTIGAAPVKVKARDASRITSACSCISVPASTVSVTYTAGTQTVTDTSTAHTTATVSTTAWATVSTVLTSGISTVSVNPPVPTNVVPNPSFNTGNAAGWSFYSNNPGGYSANVYTVPNFQGQNTYAYGIQETGSTGFAFGQSPTFTLQQGTYTFTIVEANTMFNTGGLGGPGIAFVIAGSDGSQVLNTAANGGVFIGNGNGLSWYRFTYTFNVPANAAGSNCNLRLWVNLPHGAVSYFFDDISIIIQV
ncbi:hypothetical protein PT974_02345 [Cladobotryum mycophilum]|uniref:PA14 domain-containing protein n=1 Tax=Cladobotryum mycophilum TaxID=491253 RepID=A0ABR0SZ47_9HYPO